MLAVRAKCCQFGGGGPDLADGAADSKRETPASRKRASERQPPAVWGTK